MWTDHTTPTGTAKGMEEQCSQWAREQQKVKLNTRSSTETELMVPDMYMPEMLWLLHFIEAQGYDIECVGLYQDNISTQMLIKNGRFSSGRKTKPVKAKFFFIKDWVDEGEIKVIDCPAEEMWADILTKPLQGFEFRTMRAMMMNYPINYKDEKETEVIGSRTNTSNTPVSPKKTVKWEDNLKTVFHVPQECVGRNGSNLRKGTNNERPTNDAYWYASCINRQTEEGKQYTTMNM